MIKDLEAAIGYRFKDITLLQNALAHSSYANESRVHIEYNERLEFLGDAVLQLVTSEKLYKENMKLVIPISASFKKLIIFIFSPRHILFF